MTYVVITFVVLVILNIYCSITCQQLFYQSKRESMIEKCLLVSDEIATLDVLKNYNNNSEKVGSLKKGDVVTIL